MKEANALVGGWMREAGLETREDAVGNLIGRRGDGPALMLGSHLDTVVDAGRYDGPLGVLVAIEAAELRCARPRGRGLRGRGGVSLRHRLPRLVRDDRPLRPGMARPPRRRRAAGRSRGRPRPGPRGRRGLRRGPHRAGPRAGAARRAGRRRHRHPGPEPRRGDVHRGGRPRRHGAARRPPRRADRRRRLDPRRRAGRRHRRPRAGRAECAQRDPRKRHRHARPAPSGRRDSPRDARSAAPPGRPRPRRRGRLARWRRQSRGGHGRAALQRVRRRHPPAQRRRPRRRDDGLHRPRRDAVRPLHAAAATTPPSRSTRPTWRSPSTRWSACCVPSDLVIRGATVVLPGVFPVEADVAIDGEQIAAIGPDLEARRGDRRARPAPLPGRPRRARALQRARPHALGGLGDRLEGARRRRGHRLHRDAAQRPPAHARRRRLRRQGRGGAAPPRRSTSRSGAA